MTGKEKLIELNPRNANLIQPEEFYCDRPWFCVWQATLARQWLERPSSMVQQDSDAMQWLEFWLRIGDSNALTLLTQFERAGYLERLEQVGRYPYFKVKHSYHEKIHLYVVANRRSQQATKETNLCVLDDSYFATYCHRAWTSTLRLSSQLLKNLSINSIK